MELFCYSRRSEYKSKPTTTSPQQPEGSTEGAQEPTADFWRWGATPQFSREVTSAHFPLSALWNHSGVGVGGRRETIKF